MMTTDNKFVFECEGKFHVSIKSASDNLDRDNLIRFLTRLWVYASELTVAHETRRFLSRFQLKQSNTLCISPVLYVAYTDLAEEVENDEFCITFFDTPTAETLKMAREMIQERAVGILGAEPAVGDIRSIDEDLPVFDIEGLPSGAIMFKGRVEDSRASGIVRIIPRQLRMLGCDDYLYAVLDAFTPTSWVANPAINEIVVHTGSGEAFAKHLQTVEQIIALSATED